MLFIFFAGITLISGIRIVPQQSIFIVETFGKFSRTLKPGLNFIFVPFQRVAGNVSLKIDSIKAIVEVKTSDNMFVQLPVDLMIQVDEQSSADAFYKLQKPHEQIRAWVLNTVRSTAAGMSLEEMFKDKTVIVDAVKQELRVKLNEFGYRIENVLVDQPIIPQEAQNTFNRVVSSKREKEAAQYEGEAIKVKMMLQAEAEAEAQKCRAKGMAESRKILAEGMNESIQQFHDVSIDDALRFLVEITKIDTIREVGKHGNLVLMDINSGSHDQALLPLLNNLPKKV